ncbi:MAG: NUDIX domain-containing protein [Candidatus Pacebacteria bacterium]|nr:NUDIX domain-containing protein [Candidatus Paceibacterota bacterium]
MKKATICFLVRNGEVILAKKKSKVGAGFYNGYGGKVDGEETSRQCAIRETHEECSAQINPDKIELAASIDFYTGEKPQFSCDIFIANEWVGEPKGSDEMGVPERFNLSSLPYDQMLAGDQLWFKRIMDGERFKGVMRYSADFSKVESFETEPTVF